MKTKCFRLPAGASVGAGVGEAVGAGLGVGMGVTCDTGVELDPPLPPHAIALRQPSAMKRVRAVSIRSRTWGRFCPRRVSLALRAGRSRRLDRSLLDGAVFARRALLLVSALRRPHSMGWMRGTSLP